ncbi:hypothetical protein VNI00_018049 [Paramarasmius palmivorus]|uniref:Uncharacterized protein n=1 Tax=Paramarasmius palmivorus TaxID=297713 RepID=A0AAW0B0E7_9AGAR
MSIQTLDDPGSRRLSIASILNTVPEGAERPSTEVAPTPNLSLSQSAPTRSHSLETGLRTASESKANALSCGALTSDDVEVFKTPPYQTLLRYKDKNFLLNRLREIKRRRILEDDPWCDASRLTPYSARCNGCKKGVCLEDPGERPERKFYVYSWKRHRSRCPVICELKQRGLLVVCVASIEAINWDTDDFESS